MFNEENAVEVVQRNLILLRNSVTQPNTLKRKIFGLTEVKNHLTLKTTNGLGVRKLVEICDIMGVPVEEMFYIDEHWTFDKSWDWKDTTKVREFHELEYKLDVDNYGTTIYENIQWSIDVGQTSWSDWWNTLRGHNMGLLETRPNEVNFGCKLLGRISGELGVEPDDLLYIKS